MAFATGLEGFVMLLRWCKRDVEEGYEVRKFGWFQWGFVTQYGGKAKGWYILICLPSYVMQNSFYRDVPAWHQRVLLFRELLPTGKGSWHLVEWELPDSAPPSTSSKT